MKAVVIYARYSSDMQNDRSIEDQIASCRRLLRDGEQLIDIFSDRGISGAFINNRPSALSLINKIEQGIFKVIITEGLDRLSRSQEEIARIFALTDYYGIEIRTVIEGTVSDLHVGMTGTMSALELKKNAERTRRGQRGAVCAGKAPGGLPYGYAIHPFNGNGEIEPGYRRIIPAQAKIIRAIYSDYLAGKRVGQIVSELNRQGTASPRGGKWNGSTISGHYGRGNGILQNPIYRGQLIWNRHNFSKHPKTGRRTIRPNDSSLWTVREVPELQIVDTGIWNAVQAKRASEYKAQSKPAKQTAKIGFTALCGFCGAQLIAIDERYLLCSGKKQRGLCREATKIDASALYKALYVELKQITRPKRWQEWKKLATVAQKADSENLAKVRSCIRSQRKKATNYLKAIESGLAASKLANTALLKLEHEIEKLEIQQSDLKKKVETRLPDRTTLQNSLSNARSNAARCALVDQLVASVTVRYNQSKILVLDDMAPKLSAYLSRLDS